MSEEQLYMIARQSIDRKNRRWLLWGVNLIAFLLYVGAFTAYQGIPRNVGEYMLEAWFALLVAHSTALVLMQDAEAGIDGEIAKLRQTLHEKPKVKRREVSPEAQSLRLEEESPVNGAGNGMNQANVYQAGEA